MPFTLKSDNTRVLKPMILQPLKRKLVRREKNELIGPDTRPLIIRLQAQAKSDQIYNKQRMDKAQAQTLLAMLTPFVIADPSHIAGVITSDKPFIETIGDPGVQATSNELANFIISSATPSSFIKAMAIPAVRMSATQLLYKISKGQLTKELLIKQGATLAEANWLFKELPLLRVGKSNQNKMNAILDKVANGLKGKRGANEQIQAAARFDEVTDAQKLERIRAQYKDQIDAVNAASKSGNLQLNWWDNNNLNQLGGMPEWLKLLKVGFNTRPFLDRYLSNVITKVGPKQKELLEKGLLRPTKDGKYWEGFVNGGYVKVDPYRYVISHLDRALAYGNYVDVLPTSMTNIPRHGSKSKNVGYLTHPNLGYSSTLFSIIADGTPGATKGIEYYKGKGVSLPLMTKPNLELKLAKGRVGNSNASGVSNGALAGKIEIPRGVSDPQVGGSSMNEYNFGPNIENIKSYYNTLDFEYGAGPLAMINPKLDRLLV